ncbi:hypothetical protein DMN91_002195, partial [Ooceraea biroi]
AVGTGARSVSPLLAPSRLLASRRLSRPGVDDVNVDQDTNNNDDVFMEVETLDEAGLTTNWADWTLAMLQSKKSSLLQVPLNLKPN